MARNPAPSLKKLQAILDRLEAQLLRNPQKKWVPERNMQRARRWKNFDLPRSKTMLREWAPTPLHNVVGLGIGYKRTHQLPTKTRCIVFYVVRKTTRKQRMKKEYALPSEIDGVPTDVVEVGIPRAATFPGQSIGLLAHGTHPVTGTLGLHVKRGNVIFILSNNHVLADEGRVPLLTPITAPGPGSPGTPVTIATLSQFAPAAWAATNTLDCAIAEITPGSAWQNTLPGHGDITGIASPRGGRTVIKLGQTTGLTRGTTLGNTRLSMVFHYPHASMVLFTGLIGVIGENGTPFAADGDSGSAIVDAQTNHAVGLLIAVGANGITFASHLPAVMTALNVELA